MPENVHETVIGWYRPDRQTEILEFVTDETVRACVRVVRNDLPIAAAGFRTRQDLTSMN